MFNPVIIYVILQTFSKFSFQNYFAYLVLVHASLAAVCYLSYRFYEAPFLALKEKYAVVKSGGVVSNVPEIVIQTVEPETVPLKVVEK
jgi:peptidoglycan/LPS O-acetylase OafA/YrhL